MIPGHKRRETIGTRIKSTVERTLIPTVREGQLVAVASGENHWYRTRVEGPLVPVTRGER